MRLGDFKRLCRRADTRAVIISDGCRDYVAEAHHAHGAGLLTDRRGRPLRFKSLAEARRAVDDADEILLSVRVAADEACAGRPNPEAAFATQRIA